ncbi:MAG TPA: hypothetical protein VE758_01765 [Chthoniobacterales bacterium]|jgi:ElaB/YqjD/DUF883 family membrane-anchored ribosome-binding protein|nr:hypothetical protein [Chthoniobacterales bacterium]
MINPDDDFLQEDPLSETPESSEEQTAATVRQRVRRTAPETEAATSDSWARFKAQTASARERTEVFLRENPVPTILGALGIGIAIGLAIRYASTARQEEKTPVKINWSFLSLPFLWPFFRSVKEKYDESTESLKEGVDRVRNIDVQRYTKPIRKRWRAWTS